ncbi:D-hexose-6-phosphate mutarotase [Cryobacterium levicorallinum]|nr:D-hexose-6-phosphate mutarotase [Cryobacterium levicorallinum]SFH79407.1 glucose-6-phosphate 1-epimerase [Cryobacterium levicorallinum]
MRLKKKTPSAPTPSAQLGRDQHGLLELTVEALGACATIYLHGAHVTSWKPSAAAPDVLWMSETTSFDGITPLRGGIPVCFPWFGTPSEDTFAPQHGFARQSAWDYLGSNLSSESVTAVFQLASRADDRSSHWPHSFTATYSVTVGRELQLSLKVTNTGLQAFSFEEMLHTYFAIRDLRAVSFHGLEGAPFISAAPADLRRSGPTIVGDEISRVYQGLTDPVTISDAGRNTRITSNGLSSVLWNPGARIAREFDDFQDDGWKKMVCFESGNIRESTQTLGPGASHVLNVTISVDR